MSGIEVEKKQKWTPADMTTGTSFPGFGTSGSTACTGNDSRLSDSRTPTAHAASHNAGGSDALAIDAAAGTGSLRTLGTGAQQAMAGDDSRVTGAVPSTRTLTAGSGLDGGGDLSNNRTLSVLNLTGMHVKNATESLATPATTAAVQEVVVPFTTPSITGSVGFITDRKYEVVGMDARKLTATGGAGDELQVKVAGASILSGGTAVDLSGKAADAFLLANFDTTKLVIPSGSTVTFEGTAALLDSAVRGWLRLAPVA